jgi:biotin transporter BioY
MNISKTKFVIFFLISAFAFMFISNALFGTEARVFPWHEKSFLGTDSPIAWKSAGYKISYPIKVVLVGPFNNFFHEDPPPPLVAGVFALYWSVLALIIYYLVGILQAWKKPT